MSDPITRDEELAQLRAENARLSSVDEELAHLRAQNARLKAEQESQGPVTVRVLPPETRAVMPTRAEMKELFDAVNAHWPRDFENVEHDAFAAAFCALATIHRQQDLDSSHSPGHWVALANQRLHGSGATSFHAFLAAVAAWSDIAVSDWRLKETEGVPLEFGLNEYVGRLPIDQWRATLRGEFVKPIDPRPKRHKASPEPSILIDGRPLPDSQRFTGPRYWIDF
jgi:hypothetical protein